MKFKNILIIFIAFRLLDFLIIYLSRFFIPYLGFFPYKEIALQYNLPTVLTTLANFDGAHYLIIAREGYNTYQQAFFPLYPLLIRWLSPIFQNNHLLTGIIISNLAFLLGLFILNEYLVLLKYRISHIKYLIMFLLAFPTSFFFEAVYTEGLFFLLVLGTLYFLKKDKLLTSALFAIMASLTKLIGVFLVIFFILKLIRNCLPAGKARKLEIRNFRLILASLSPILGITIYMIYLWFTTKDPLFFLNSQWAFGAHRSSNLIFIPQVIYRYLKIFFTAQFNFQYFISLFEFVTFIFVFWVLVLDSFRILKLKFASNLGFRISDLNYDKLGLSLFSLINLVLPTLTGTLSSIPRYALFSLTFFIYLGLIKNNYLKIFIAVLFFLLHFIMLGFFTQGYFIS